MVWEGYEMETGSFQDYEYGIVFPKEMAPGRPYIWRTEFFDVFPGVDLAMLEKGYAVVYYRISDLYGCPEAVALMEAFQPFIQEKYGLSPQAILFGFSRGGLYALHYGAKCPERIAALYLDAPVVDIYSWPGGCFSAEGSPAEWADCRKLWDMSHDAYRDKVDAAVRVLLDWAVPVIIVAGGKDEQVPWQENGALLQEAYEKSGAPFEVVMKPDCGHHPHSLDDPSPVVDFLLRYRSYPTIGNAFRINDQSKTAYPVTLIVHDREHMEVVMEAEHLFSGRYPFGHVGTSPWPGSVTNQKTMAYGDPQNSKLYDLMRKQAQIGQIIYGLDADGEAENDIPDMIKDMKEKCPAAGQYWIRRRGEAVPGFVMEVLSEYGISVAEYGSQEELRDWLEKRMEEIERAQPPKYFDALDREAAEWSNLSVTLPVEDEENRLLLVGDSISAGYGDMVQKQMPGWHVDRLNTSEGLHHPNFLRLLEIALERYPYRIVHINNGIHLHGQSVEQYGRNLSEVFEGIRRLAPKAQIIFATTTPLSRCLSGDELESFQAEHFTMGDRVPLAPDRPKGEYWITDKEASEIYRKLNEEAERICAGQGIRVNDLYRLCVDENLQKSDGVHFQEEAYWRLAGKVAEALTEAGRQKEGFGKGWEKKNLSYL